LVLYPQITELGESNAWRPLDYLVISLMNKKNVLFNIDNCFPPYNFFFFTDEVNTSATTFVPGKPFQPGLKLEGKVRKLP
jgi:hypothetical protein